MHYRISRNGQLYGPYTLEDLQRYLASGNVLPTDLAKSDEMADWLPVSQLLAGPTSVPAAAAPIPTQHNVPTDSFSDQPSIASQAAPDYTEVGYASPPYNPSASSHAAFAASQYQDAPNLNWGIYLLLSIVTCTLFSKVFTLVQAAWLKRVQPNSNALIFYAGLYIIWIISFFVNLGRSLAMIAHQGSPYTNPGRGLLTLLYFILLIVTRFVMSNSLEEHFNTAEPVGLKLNPVMVFFFGGIYFQYHLNRINAMKQAARFAPGRAY